MMKAFLKIVFTFFICSIAFLVNAQHRVKTHDLGKKFTALNVADDGRLVYGTNTGEIGYYDGLQIEKLSNLNGRINAIKKIDDQLYFLSDNGMYILEKDETSLIVGKNIKVLDINDQMDLVIARNGIYRKSGNDYIPHREAFLDVNEVNRGSFFEVEGEVYVRLGKVVFKKNKTWEEAIFHRSEDYGLVPFERHFYIGDDRGIVRFDVSNQVDTLMRSDSLNIQRLFKVDSRNLLVAGNDKVQLFDITKRIYKDIHTIKTDLITSATVDKWGSIWISAGSYLYQIIDTQNPESLRPPEVRITDLKVNAENRKDEHIFKLKKNDNDLFLSFRGIQLTIPQDLEYQTKISFAAGNRYESSVPNINSWTPLSKKNQVQYHDLPAGKYKIEVRSTIDNKYFTYLTPSIIVSVDDDTFQKIWMLGLLSALALLGMALFFNNRYNRLEEKLNQERKLLKQENKMLTLQQKALQLQMNPHFVFNALNSIQGLIAKEDNKNARKYLQQFSSMMRSVLNQSREETITLEDEITYLKSYLSLEQMANNNSFDYKFVYDEELEDDIRIPTMILQPFIENAIIHGVKSMKNRRGEIRVSFVLEEHNLICTITDNGVGRDVAAKNKVSSHKSIAIDVVRERLTTKKSLKDPIQYTDLKSNDGSIEGTEVKIIIKV